MDRMIKIVATVATILALAGPSETRADLVGLWKLNGNLGNTVGATPLDDIGYTMSFIGDTINAQPAQVADVPQLGDSFARALRVTNEAGANGGGARTNEWTLLMDVRFSALGGNVSLMRQDTADDTQVYITPGGGITTSWTGAFFADGTIAADTWYRIAIARAPGVGNFNVYIDGVAGTAQDGFGVDDSDFSLYPFFDLLGDNNVETSAARLNSVAFFDEVLSPSAIAALGGPTGEGLFASIPAPAALPAGLLALGALGMRRRRHG